MSDDEAHVHHAIDYVEITVTDLDRAKAFYAAAFGWQFRDYGPDYAGIRWLDGDGGVGGLAVGAAPAVGGSSGVTVLLWSGDLDATVAAVESAGGTVVETPYAFPGGRRFFFHDPDGNRLGVWASS
ncbi:VOC family protein [Nocardioides rubriscoriae]|uniref:VOC family protein n=1 Tax=Nocardioides rubriscoriae TaxID=642762 RepID=UPI0011DFDD88|nr:VOC family protein [Nocardioides rubriscoriae]